MAEDINFDAILDIVAVMDQRIAEEWRRLHDEARERKIPLRTGLFANSYVFPTSHAPGIAQVYSQIHTGLFRRLERETVTEAIQNWMARNDLSAGQHCLLLALCSRCLGAAHVALPLITRALRCDWANAPYHLRLELMHAAQTCWRVDETGRTAPS